MESEKRKAGRPKVCVDDKRVPFPVAVKRSYAVMLRKVSKIEKQDDKTRSVSRIAEDAFLDYFVKMGYPHDTLI